jgi:cellulase
MAENMGKGKWGNEIIIDQDYRNTIQLPSDIKPGTYILRTELLSLHGNGRNVGILGKPQFYTHCFNLDIQGTGNVEPEGVTFPGGYKKDGPGENFVLRGGQASYDKYVSGRTITKLCDVLKTF